MNTEKAVARLTEDVRRKFERCYSLLHADPIKERAGAGDTGVLVGHDSSLAGEVAFDSGKGRGAGRIGATLEIIGHVGHALPANRDAGDIPAEGKHFER